MAFRPKPPDRRYSADLANAYGRGYPLFDPQPDTTQQPPRPVEIGDVGYIKPVLGYFVRLFNIHLQPGIDGQPDRDRLPDHFQPEPRGEIRNSPSRGMHLFVSDTVNAPEVSAQVPVGPFFGGFAQFSASRKHGAILATPDRLLSSFDSLSDRRFEEYVKNNVRDWERFLAEKVPGRVELEDLLLITGVDRTTSWANAVFSNTTLKVGFGLEVQFVPGADLACRYTWRNIAKATTKFGPNLTTSDFDGSTTMFPEQDITQPTAEQRPVNEALDQTIFIRHIRCKRRWKLLLRKQDVADHDMEVDRPANAGMAIDGAGVGNTHDTEGDDSDNYMTADEDADAADAFDIVSSPEHEEFTDYLEEVLDHILQDSNADIAMARHDDLGRLPTNDPSSKPRIVVADGVAMFHRRDVARSPSLETLIEEVSMSDPLSTDDSGTVAMNGDGTSIADMFAEPSTSATNVHVETTESSRAAVSTPHHHTYMGGDGGSMVNEYLVMGYIAMSFGPDNAIKLFNKFVGSREFRHPPSGISRYNDRSFRSAGRPDVILDYDADQKGIIVQQKMWQPAQTGDVNRHFRDAIPIVLAPVFFIRPDWMIGVEMSRVLNARPGTPVNILHSNEPAPLGGVATTHFCLKWPGYAQEFRKEVEAKDSNRATITMSKLVERIASFVQRFIDEAANWPIDQKEALWRVGPGYINKDRVYIVGLVHVSAGCWQPIIQLMPPN